MTRIARARHENESGVVLVIVACCIVVLLGMLSIAIDASYGFVQNRRAQNASDFAAFAAAQQLDGSYYCNGLSAPTGQAIVDIVQNIVADNDADVGTAWTAKFLDSTGAPVPFVDASGNTTTTFSYTDYPTLPPQNSCGVSVTASPSWTPFFAGVFGIHKLGGQATASVTPQAGSGTPLSIVALNKTGPHEILGGGTGEFVVSGDVFLNTNVSNQPWTGSYVDTATGVSWAWDDAIDAKTNSNLYVYGTIHSNNGTYNNQPLWPLDTCFNPNVLGNGNPGGTPNPAYQDGDPATGQLPADQMQCQEWGGSVNIDYDAIDPTVAQIDDPLASADAPPSPISTTTDIACPGSTLQTNPAMTLGANNTTELEPGEYTTPVKITGSAVFNDCAGGYTGIYRFDQGLWINPAAGDAVTGSNVVLATENPYPVAGNVPGSVTGGTFTATPGESGNGAPCLPAGTLSSAASGHNTPEVETSSNACGGTSPTTYGVIGYGDSSFAPDPAETGTGNNFSDIIGGAAGSTVTLTGPTSGIYGGTDGNPGLVLYQDPSTQANFGFNAEPGDAATIAINGVVYNASLDNYGASSPLDYWDGIGGGIPFYAGGTLQTGYGAGWAANPGPTPSAGSVTLTGTAIVDDFNTDGATDITIIGKPYTLAGDTNLKLID